MSEGYGVGRLQKVWLETERKGEQKLKDSKNDGQVVTYVCTYNKKLYLVWICRPGDGRRRSSNWTVDNGAVDNNNTDNNHGTVDIEAGKTNIPHAARGFAAHPSLASPGQILLQGCTWAPEADRGERQAGRSMETVRSCEYSST